MTTQSTQPPPLPGSSPDEMFPVLSAEQQARVLTHGHIRKVISGETLGAGNLKREASAVGEGSIGVSFVHQVLAE